MKHTLNSISNRKESILSKLIYLFCLTFLAALNACNSSNSGTKNIQVGEGDLGGVVTGPNGPEAGVWIIAETHDLPTRFAKIVVTDDKGRYVLPDLPKANYSVWVRGYGLVDSPKKQVKPGQNLDLTAVVAPTPQAAAEYYPAGYWFSMLHVPEKSKFPGTGPDGNGILSNVKTQANFLSSIKSGTCLACHQLGSKGTREFQKSLGTFNNSVDAWERRLRSGQAGPIMTSALHQIGKDEVLRMFADWTDRIKAGELPPAPPRPEGIERNVVITQWDWADPKVYLHDLVSTDRRNPTVNANGPLYGALEASADYLPVLDPITHTTSQIPLTVRDPNTPVISGEVLEPSPYWGTEAIWNSKTNVHNPMMDGEGNVWITAAVRPTDNLDNFKDHPSAKLFPLKRSGRHLGVYNPKTKKYTPISTNFSTHHLMFAEDNKNTLWTSGGGEVIGWFDTKKYQETGDEKVAQGWTALILDTNGNGKRDAYVEPDQPVDPKKDKRITKGLYSVAPAPDGSVWGSTLGYPGGIVRLVPGTNPSETALVEYYELPIDDKGEPVEGFSPRGMDIDRNGVAWVALASGHLASFDRRKVKNPLNGPNATGQHGGDGWTFYTEPLPQLKGVNYKGSAESSYYTWVDQFNTFGLGENIPINTGNESEALLVLKDGKWVKLRVPYPMGFYTKWLDGRIDDPKGGWKGRGLWATISTRAPFHMEGGKGTTSKVFKFQMRPDPLAR
ncbi:carboxypeptidase-like regulatory domain-containing protein [Adhaeribacter radiodurans]|uniref:carboxypeptidase-like regulatory domain-containing protein n=1 Tax=Adhaeribacter radiodurans TaxID=2745197 RepID=UPI001C71554A|nr:carboxypeptidase-like regulatory domain-containing protein [Adhaeribacter radiodurans]